MATAMFRKTASLPVSHSDDDQSSSSSVAAGMRRRLSSMSLRIQPSAISGTTTATAWAMRRSKSVSSMGESASTSIRNWWDWGWGWILSRKPQDLESSFLTCSHDDKGSWKHVIFKLRSEIRKLIRSDQNGLPQYNSSSSSSYGIGSNSSRAVNL